MTCSGKISAFAVNGRRPKDDGYIPNVPALAQHHHADNRLDLAFGTVDVAGRRARHVEVLLGDLACGVGVDD